MVRVYYAAMETTAKETAGREAVVVGLNVFPVKSCRAVSCAEVEVDAFGVVGDRRFMVAEGARFTSQRKLPRLALISVSYVGEEEKKEEGDASRKKKRLLFSAPGIPEFLLDPVFHGERVEIGLWRDTVRVIDQGDGIAKWLNEYIGMGSSHLRLVASADENPGGYCRPISELHVPDELRNKLSDRHVALSDTGPVSLVSHESLADLNRRLKTRGGEEVGLKQFRMNIEVSGCSEPFEEDKWLLIQIGTIPLLAYRHATVSRKVLAKHYDNIRSINTSGVQIKKETELYIYKE